MDTDVTLISETYSYDAIGQAVKSEHERTVFAHVLSIDRSEFFNAGQVGLSPALKILTPAINYMGEEIAKVDGNRYTIYRTFHSVNSDEIELYCERRTGVTNG